MRYKNADKVLPKALMDEVQQYIQGEYLYIPKAEGTKKKWGDNTGARRMISIRNDAIRQGYQNGKSMEDLAKAYYLSVSSIKRIVYGKSNK